MRVFKTRQFSRWAVKEGLSDQVLQAAVVQMEEGRIDADLGGQLYKQRIRLQGRGKRGGARTLVAYRAHDKAFFLYGFAKNARANIRVKELKALRLLSRELLGYTDAALKEMLIYWSRLSGPCSVQLQGAVRREGWLPFQAQQRRGWTPQGPPFGALPESQPLRCAFSPYLDTLSKPRLDADFLAKPEARRIDQRFPGSWTST